MDNFTKESLRYQRTGYRMPSWALNWLVLLFCMGIWASLLWLIPWAWQIVVRVP
jgi:hypothetical protein